jgi:phosphonate transport system substrate-binding protein
MRAVPALLAIIGAIGLPAPGRPAEGAAPYTFAIVPQAPPSVIGRLWGPVVERISADAGVPLKMKLYERFEDFHADLASGAVDLVYLNPVQAVRAHRTARYRPLIRNDKPVRGVFFVERDSAFTSVASLARREVAFVGPWSFCSVTCTTSSSTTTRRWTCCSSGWPGTPPWPGSRSAVRTAPRSPR